MIIGIEYSIYLNYNLKKFFKIYYNNIINIIIIKMGNCLDPISMAYTMQMHNDMKKNIYVPVPEEQIYKSPDQTFITTFGVIPEIVPPTPYSLVR